MHCIGKYLLIFSLIFSSFIYASEDWSLKKERDGIQIFTKSVEGSKYKMVRGVTHVNARISSAVALIRDSEACAQWADRCASSKVYKTFSANDQLVYTLNDLPWPVSDRDVLARVTWKQNPETYAVTMVSMATEGEMEKNKGIVRLTKAMAKWIFTPLSDGRLEVVTEAHVNPGGPLPAWVTNLLLVDSPFKTLENFRVAVSKDKYESSHFDFVKEPKAAK